MASIPPFEADAKPIGDLRHSTRPGRAVFTINHFHRRSPRVRVLIHKIGVGPCVKVVDLDAQGPTQMQEPALARDNGIERGHQRRRVLHVVIYVEFVEPINGDAIRRSGLDLAGM